ncbi:uncharacterized protein LOC120928890 [Rana temporaria]|uniref:uncharacterized protein LOC120928890 n=2 Tax=Rana temporaria TaxID=8407 RepID=UPI001AADA679|nr:uncharacterized protein LOC120928890 [Rana temporaria]
MEFYLRQLMDRAAAPGGEEWMKLCLSLAPPSSVLQEADEAVCSASMSLPATAPPPVPGLFLPHVDRGDRQVDLPMGVNEVGLAASSALPPPEVNDDVQVNANTVAGRTGRSVYKRTQKLRRCYSPSPPKNTKKGRSDNTLTVSAPAQCPIPVVTSDTAPTQRGESLDSAALSDIISNFSLVSGQLQQLLSRTSLPAMDVSHAWSNQQSAQSTCVPSQVMQVEPIANVHEIANVPESCFREAMACELSPLGFHLSANVKAKIWKGDYMDILSLLPAAEDRPLRRDQEKVVDDKRKIVPRSFNNWLQAFCIYASVMGEKHPEICYKMFHHVEIILEAYKNFPGLAWFTYDESFRQKLAVHGSLRWGTKDVGLWLNLLLPQRPMVRSPPVQTGPFRKGLCFSFNEGQCKWPHTCRFRHECSNCSGVHPASRCFKKVALTPQPQPKDTFRKSSNPGEVGRNVTLSTHLAASSGGGLIN